MRQKRFGQRIFSDLLRQLAAGFNVLTDKQAEGKFQARNS
jgi:hypothetical protein